MTADDAFDARLKAAFAAAEPKDDAAFAERVIGRLSGWGRRRALILGGAGAAGSAIASTQLQDFYGKLGFAAAEALGNRQLLGDHQALLALLRPEALAAMTIALMVALLAYVLPSRS